MNLHERTFCTVKNLNIERGALPMKNILKARNLAAKKAEGSIETAIKVLTAVVLGAAILVGLYALIKNVVLPSTTTKVNSMFSYSAA